LGINKDGDLVVNVDGKYFAKLSDLFSTDEEDTNLELGLLGLCSYLPESDSNIVSGSGSTIDTDVDSENAKVTFIAPESGKVLFHLSALAGNSNAINPAYWMLLDEETKKDEAWVLQSTSINRYHCDLFVSDLIEGNSYTYKWGYRLAGGATSHSIFAGPTYGRLMMKAWAVL